MDLFNVFEELLVLQSSGRLRSEAPFVVALEAHAKDPAGHRDVESGDGEL